MQACRRARVELAHPDGYEPGAGRWQATCMEGWM